jgi:Mini-chromosome maintenance replisome factor
MEEIVQQDFIQSRVPGKENPMTPEDFHLLLVLSRLLALTYGHKELTDTVWQRAKAMESERQSRISMNNR